MPKKVVIHVRRKKSKCSPSSSEKSVADDHEQKKEKAVLQVVYSKGKLRAQRKFVGRGSSNSRSSSEGLPDDLTEDKEEEKTTKNEAGPSETTRKPPEILQIRISKGKVSASKRLLHAQDVAGENSKESQERSPEKVINEKEGREPSEVLQIRISNGKVTAKKKSLYGEKISEEILEKRTRPQTLSKVPEEPSTSHPGPSTFHPEPTIFDPGRSTPYPGVSSGRDTIETKTVRLDEESIDAKGEETQPVEKVEQTLTATKEPEPTIFYPGRSTLHPGVSFGGDTIETKTVRLHEKTVDAKKEETQPVKKVEQTLTATEKIPLEKEQKKIVESKEKKIKEEELLEDPEQKREDEQLQAIAELKFPVNEELENHPDVYIRQLLVNSRITKQNVCKEQQRDQNVYYKNRKRRERRRRRTRQRAKRGKFA